jgi:hypothetical protein
MRHGRTFNFGENLSPLLRAMKKMARQGASADEIMSAVRCVVPGGTMGDHVIFHAEQFLHRHNPVEKRYLNYSPIQEQADGTLRIVESSWKSRWTPGTKPWYKTGILDDKEIIYKIDGAHIWMLVQDFVIRFGALYRCVELGYGEYTREDFRLIKEEDAKWTALTKKEKKRFKK